MAGKEPIELLKQAETERKRNAKYSASRFRRELYGTGSTREPRLLILARQVARVRPEAVKKIAGGREVEAIIDAAMERLTAARRSLRRA